MKLAILVLVALCVVSYINATSEKENCLDIIQEIVGDLEPSGTKIVQDNFCDDKSDTIQVSTERPSTTPRNMKRKRVRTTKKRFKVHYNGDLDDEENYFDYFSHYLTAKPDTSLEDVFS